MNTDAFWKLIETARKAAQGDTEAFIDSIREALADMPEDDIVQFKFQLTSRLHEAYTWPLWGAAYIIQGGCSDDMFEYFRAWLVAQGRAAFEKAVRDPDKIGALGLDLEDEDAFMDFESLLYVAAEVYEERTGKELPEAAYPKGPKEPTGTPWSEDGDDLSRLLPKLSKKFQED